MVYIFVGPDGAGKSTVFDIIRKDSGMANAGVHFIKEDHPRSTDEKVDRMLRLSDVVHDRDRSHIYIFDQHTVIDDYVYSVVIDRKKPEINIGDMLNLLQGQTIFYLYSDIYTLQSRINKRGDEYVGANQLSAIYDRYEALLNTFDMAGINVVEMNTAYQNPEDTAAYVLEYIGKKVQKFAHIVPVSGLHLLDSKKYLMCLAQLVLDNKEYARYYANRAKMSNTYVLMDNGAAEGDQLSMDDLIRACRIIEPDEIVLPDTLYDADDTLNKFNNSLSYFKTDMRLPYKIMAVPQGATFEDWKRCAEEMVKDIRVDTLGISKFIHIFSGNDNIRYDAAEYIECLMNKYKRYNLEVHLLGCSEPLCVVNKIFDRFNFVRGCDSALAYIYAQNNKHPYQRTPRPIGDIDFINGQCPDSLESCMDELEIAAGVYHNGVSDDSWIPQATRYSL